MPGLDRSHVARARLSTLAGAVDLCGEPLAARCKVGDNLVDKVIWLWCVAHNANRTRLA
jgi:hypothetical protein